MSAIFSTEPQTLIGYWWLPSNSSDHVPGTLAIKPGHYAHLDLLGTFSGANGPTMGVSKHIDRIFGIVQGNLITLENCQLNFGGLSSPGFFKSSVIADGVFLGGHVAEDCFSEVTFEMSGLKEWAPICGFDVNEADIKNRRAHLAYKEPPPIKFALDGKSRLELRSSTRGFPVFPGIRTELNICLIPYFAISFNDPLPLSEIQRYIHRIWQFLQFCTNQNIKICNVKPKAVTVDKTSGESVEIRNLTYVPSGGSSLDETYDATKALMPFQYIYQDRTLFKRWFSLTEKMESAFDIHFASERKMNGYSEEEFISRVSTLEIAHRRTNSISPQEKKGHDIRLNEIYDQLASSPHLDWLKKKLAHSHEPTLEQRLLELATAVGPHIPNQDIYSPAFLKKVAKTRNYLTHFSKGDQKKQLPLSDIPEASMKLRALFLVYVLICLGLQKELLGELIRRSRKLEYELNG